MIKFKTIFVLLLRRIISIKIPISIIRLLVRIFNIDLQDIYFRLNGISKYQNSFVNGENHLIKTILPKFIPKEKAIVMDVGANVGKYTCLLNDNLNISTIFSFEINPVAFKNLKANISQYSNVIPINTGLSDRIGKDILYVYEDLPDSEHSTLYISIMSEFHKTLKIKPIEVELNTLDEYCAMSNITKIDFIKIDTEGNDLKVLQGAKNLLNNGQISAIQFEFNELCVYSRSFLKDFYELLPDYEFFRMDTHKLIPLGNYKTEYEIFKFQNIFALHNKLSLRK